MGIFKNLLKDVAKAALDSASEAVRESINDTGVKTKGEKQTGYPPRGSQTVHFYDETMTGYPDQVMEALIRAIAAICRSGSNTKRLYIGIASGEDAISAMRRRDDVYKIEQGINEMVALYETSSQRNCRIVETRLIEYFQTHDRNINRVGGGGGKASAGPYFYVYAALRRWG